MNLMLSRLLIAFVLGLIILPVIGWCYFRFGYASFATASSPMPFEKRLAHIALNARIAKEAPNNAPSSLPRRYIRRGPMFIGRIAQFATVYPASSQLRLSKGMYPKRPQLFKGHEVTDDPVGETYWKVANGIRLTGMPAYTNALSETEM